MNFAYDSQKSRQEKKELNCKMNSMKNKLTIQLSKLCDVESKYEELNEAMMTQITNDDQKQSEYNVQEVWTQNQQQLSDIKTNIERILTDSDEELIELSVIPAIEIINQIDELEEESTKTIENNTKTDKNDTIDKIQQTLGNLKRIKAKNQNKFDNILTWTTSYLADQYPLIPTMILAHSALVDIIDSNLKTNECNLGFVISRWIALFVIMLYLTVMGYKISKFRCRMWMFIRHFYMNWFIFIILMAIQTSVPPLPCYYAERVIGIIGIITAVIVALSMWLWRKPRVQHEFYKRFGTDKVISEPLTVKDTDDTEWEHHPYERLTASKAENVPYISAVYYNEDKDKGIKIFKVDIKGYSDFDFAKSENKRQHEMKDKLNQHLENNEEKEEEDGGDEEPSNSYSSASLPAFV